MGFLGELKQMVLEKTEESKSRVLERNKQRKNDKSKVGMVLGNNDNFQIGSFRRGDIVWARAFRQTWWPGLVLRRDRLGVLVWFFDCERPQYFSESGICSFDENFKSLFRNVECGMLLDRVLILLGRRAALSLMCPCQISMEDLKRRNLMDVGWNSMEQVVEVTSSCQPVVVLGFVLGMAVCPWVEDADIVNAVREAAQIKTFRHYVSIQQGLIYRGTKNRSTIDDPEASMRSIYSKLQSYSSFGKEKYSLTQESDSLEVEGKCQVFSELVEKNLEVCVTNIMNSRSLVPKETFDIVSELGTSMEENLKSVGGDQIVLNSEIKKLDRDGVAQRDTVTSSLKPQIRSRTRKGSAKLIKAQSLHEMLVNLHCLALDPFYLGGESLKTMEQNFLNFRILSYQNIADLPPRKCSPSKTIIAQFSHSGYDYSFKTRLSDKVDGKSGGVETFGGLERSPVNHLESKRRLDQPAVSNPLKLRKTMPFFSITGSYLQRNRIICDADLSDAFFSGSLVQFKTLNHPSTGSQNLTSISTNTLMCLDMVQNNVSLVKDTSYCSEIVEVGIVQEPEENASFSNDNRTCVSYDYDANDKITNGVQTEDDVQVDCRFSLLQSASVESVFKNAIGTHADKIADASVFRNITTIPTTTAPPPPLPHHHHRPTTTTRKCRLLSHLSVDQTKMQQPSNNDMINREASMKVAYEDRVKDTLLDQPDTCDLSFKSEADEKSRRESSFDVPTSLHMKFPKDFDMPSKDELVKKFTRFGSVDSLKSKIFFYTSSAQVVFLDRLDAVAACQFAKRKKVLFGQANVRFWLDPFEYSRNGISLTTPPVCNLKSCLKKSIPLGKEDRKKSHRVRFLLIS